MVVCWEAYNQLSEFLMLDSVTIRLLESPGLVSDHQAPSGDGFDLMCSAFTTVLLPDFFDYCISPVEKHSKFWSYIYSIRGDSLFPTSYGTGACPSLVRRRPPPLMELLIRDRSCPNANSRHEFTEPSPH